MIICPWFPRIHFLKIACFALTAGFCLAVPWASFPSPSGGQQDPWVALQEKGARVDELFVRVNDVFDLTKPDENHWLGRAADFVHITTRARVVKQTILFAEGDPVDARLIHESERLLRELSFVRDAEIVPVVSPGGKVTAKVTVRDAWSIKGGIKIHHAGGQSNWRIRLDERDFLGFGKQVLVSHEKDYERTTDQYAYGDPHLFGSRWTLFTEYRDLSDGSGKFFRIEKPFYALDTPWSAGFSAARTRSHETLYNDGHAVYAFPAILQDVRAYAGVAFRRRERSVQRLSLEFRATADLYGNLVTYRPDLLPEPLLAERRYRGLLLHWQFYQDRFRTFENLAAIDRVEDLNLGWSVDAWAGYFFKSLDSVENAPYGEMVLSKGFASGDNGLFLWELESHGRKSRGRFEDLLAKSRITYYNQGLPYQTLAVNLDVAAGNRLDPEDIIYLGGDDGLRGYTNHFQAGDRRWVLSMEDRIVTPWSLWGLARVGFVGFADAGAARNFRMGRMSRTYADVGLGLRFGNLKSAFGRIFFLGVAFPLVREPGVDSYQVVVGNVVRF